MQTEQLIKKLNSSLKFVRKYALSELKRYESSDPSLQPNNEQSQINLNIHSNCSFAPYSPTMAAYMAYKSGIKLACLCDYGTVNGVNEFNNACATLGINTINGFELTVKSNLLGNCVTAYYCISEDSGAFNELLSDYREICHKRAKAVCGEINKKLKKYGININFKKEVEPLSRYKKGGCITLKHVYMATGKKIAEKYERGERIAEFLRDDLCFDIDEGSYNLLCDQNNPFYDYDLILALRSNFNNITGGVNPPDISEYLSKVDLSGVIKAYQYNCKSNWIKNQAESDQTIEEFKNMVTLVKQEGYNAVCVSARNLTSSLLCKFVEILKENHLLAIFTEKTEYPRNHFACAVPPQAQPYMDNCAYAMLGNAICCKSNPNDGMFEKKSSVKCSNFEDRISIYSNIGRKSF